MKKIENVDTSNIDVDDKDKSQAPKVSVSEFPSAVEAEAAYSNCTEQYVSDYKSWMACYRWVASKSFSRPSPKRMSEEELEIEARKFSSQVHREERYKVNAANLEYIRDGFKAGYNAAWDAAHEEKLGE